MYGPPGTSKTLLARAIATESNLNFICVKGPELLSKWVGASENAIHALFKTARLNSPSIIFFDEIDAIGCKRPSSSTKSETRTADRILSQLLSELDGLNSLDGVQIVAATNRPDLLDEALLRSGRFDRHLYVSLPDFAARVSIFKVLSISSPLSIDFDKWSSLTEGWSGAEIMELVQAGGYIALEEDPINAQNILDKHLSVAYECSSSPRTSLDILDIYKNFKRKQ